jgi:hypothetical protein
MKDEFRDETSTERLVDVVSTLQILQGYDSAVAKLKKEIESRFSNIEPNKMGVKEMVSREFKLHYHHNGILKTDYNERNWYPLSTSIELSPFDVKKEKQSPCHPDKPKSEKEGVSIKKLEEKHNFLKSAPLFYKWLYCKSHGVKLRKGSFKEKDLLAITKIIEDINKEDITEELKLNLMHDVVKTKYRDCWFSNYKHLQYYFIRLVHTKIATGRLVENIKSEKKYYSEYDFSHDKKYMCLILNPTIRQMTTLQDTLWGRNVWDEKEKTYKSVERKTTQINFDTVTELLKQFKDLFKDYVNKDDIYETLDKLGFDVSEYMTEKPTIIIPLDG